MCLKDSKIDILKSENQGNKQWLQDYVGIVCMQCYGARITIELWYSLMDNIIIKLFRIKLGIISICMTC